MNVRAGGYAEFRGAVYACASVGKPMIRLFAPGDRPAPDGFSAHADGRWTRLVPRADVERLFFVKTEATWEGQPVDVLSVDGDFAEVSSRAYPPPRRPEVQRDRASWDARVSVAELHDVLETVTEVPT